jgi:hypothetical protein
MSPRLLLVSILLSLVSCNESSPSDPARRPPPPPLRSPLESCLAVGIDLAEGLGASPKLLAELRSHRGAAKKFVDGEVGLCKTFLMDEERPDTYRLALVILHRLKDDHLGLWVAERGEFPEQALEDLRDCVKRHGYGWIESDEKELILKVKILSPSGSPASEIDFGSRSHFGREVEAREVVDRLAETLGKATDLGLYPVPGPQMFVRGGFFILALRARHDALRRKYGERWSQVLSLESDWSTIPLPPK